MGNDISENSHLLFLYQHCCTLHNNPLSVVRKDSTNFLSLLSPPLSLSHCFNREWTRGIWWKKKGKKAEYSAMRGVGKKRANEKMKGQREEQKVNRVIHSSRMWITRDKWLTGRGLWVQHDWEKKKVVHVIWVSMCAVGRETKYITKKDGNSFLAHRFWEHRKKNPFFGYLVIFTRTTCPHR